MLNKIRQIFPMPNLPILHYVILYILDNITLCEKLKIRIVNDIHDVGEIHRCYSYGCSTNIVVIAILMFD